MLHQFAKSAADAVALHGGADLARAGESDADGAAIGPVPSLKGKSRRGNARIRRGSEKVRSLPETFHAG